jgi:hypothetical protein
MIETFINGLTDKPAANTLRAKVADEREIEVVRVATLNIRIKSFSGTRENITEGLTSITGELTGLQSAILSLPAGGERYLKMADEIEKLKYQKYVLESRNRDKSVEVLIELAHDVEIAESIIAAKDSFLALLDAKIATMA